MIIAQEISYREYGSGEDFTIVRIPDGADITLSDVVRGVTYEVEVRNVDHTGRLSAPATFTHTVSAAAREGALALPVNAIANIPSTWAQGAVVGFSATNQYLTVNVTASTLVVGAQTVSYSASSTTISSSPGEAVSYYLYYDDPLMQGGTRALGITEDYIESIQGYGRVAVGSLRVTAPLDDTTITGGGSISGSGGGNGAGQCPSVDSIVISRRGVIRAGDVVVGDELLLCTSDGACEEWGVVTVSRRERGEAVKITSGGASLTCSNTAPIPTGKGYSKACDMLGMKTFIRRKGLSVVESVEPVGVIDVQLITVGDRNFWVGDSPDYLFLHHNRKIEEDPLL